MAAKSTKTKILHNNHTSIVLLRSGLAIVFLYAAVSSLKTPLEWVGYLPHFLNGAHATAWIKFIAVIQVALGMWLISGYYLKYAGLVCALSLAAIIIFNPHDLIVTFRDIGLAFAALSLVFIDK